MKKIVKIICILLFVYFIICIVNIFRFFASIDDLKTDKLYIKKSDIVQVFNKDESVFETLVLLFEEKYKEINLNYDFKPAKIYLSERDYEEYVFSLFSGEDVEKVNECFEYIFEDLKFTDFIIEENHVYKVQQRELGNTEVGAIFTYNEQTTDKIMGNWYYHYKRDFQSFNYVGRWLYDLIYN